MFYDILERKNAFLNYKNSMFKKWKNWDFCKGANPWFWSKIDHFSIFFFLGILGEENVFYGILERKNTFLGYKNSILKSGKFAISGKGLTHGFGPKLTIFPCFFLGNIGQQNVFYDILERKNAFLGHKNRRFKKWKNWDFCKGVNPWFWSKIGHFSIFLFLSVIGQENVSYDILEPKKRLSKL